MSAAAQPLRPSDEAELADIVASAAADAAPLEIVGGGTRRAFGRPAQAARSVATTGLSGVRLYEPGSLTLVVGAGAPMTDIEAALAEHGQRLDFDPMDHRRLLGTSGAPTIGGAAAVGAAGPRRVRVGGLRDSLIGVRFVNGRGEAIRSGGRVMKNVTGYDLVKLMAGAFGTLGVLTELAFKLAPTAETETTVRLHGLSDVDAVRAMALALGSPYEVAAAAHGPDGFGDVGAPTTCLRLEGFAASVAARAEKLTAVLADHFAEMTTLDAAASKTLWADIRDCAPFADRTGAVWRLSLKPSDAPGVAAAIARERDAAHFYDLGGGLLWVLSPEDGDAGAAPIRAAAARAGGRATLVRAPEAVRAATPVFQPEPPAIAALEKTLRAAFDPAGILNPGRMSP